MNQITPLSFAANDGRNGIIFDVLQCLLQRNFQFATQDVRTGYARLKGYLYDAEVTKVVFILHSQGGIEGGLIIDWLLQEVPRDLMMKLEVYTFGCAANHFNNPHARVEDQSLAFSSSKSRKGGMFHSTGSSLQQVSDAAHEHPAHTAESGKVIAHIEHYGHTEDFVARWGVLNYLTTKTGPTIPRYMGRIFVRAAMGHQFIGHYLDGMFPLKRKRNSSGDEVPFTGADNCSAFMEEDMGFDEINEDGDMNREAVSAFSSDESSSSSSDDQDEVSVASTSSRGNAVKTNAMRAMYPSGLKVKDLSRLWKYRNGRCPVDIQ